MNKAHSRPLNISHLLGVDRLNLLNKHRNSGRCAFSTDSGTVAALSFVGINPTSPGRQQAVSHVIEDS